MAAMVALSRINHAALSGLLSVIGHSLLVRGCRCIQRTRQSLFYSRPRFFIPAAWISPHPGFASTGGQMRSMPRGRCAGHGGGEMKMSRPEGIAIDNGCRDKGSLSGHEPTAGNSITLQLPSALRQASPPSRLATPSRLSLRVNSRHWTLKPVIKRRPSSMRPCSPALPA